MPDPEPTEQQQQPSLTEHTISWQALWRVAVALLLVYLLLQLRLLAAMLFAAALIATTLVPILRWVVRRGGPRWLGVLLCAVVIFSLVGGFVAVLVPTFSTQGSALIEKLPTMRESFVKQLPETGELRYTADQLLGNSAISDPRPLLKGFVAWGAVAVEGLTAFIIVLVIAIYLVADGEQVYQWLVAFLPRRHRPRVAETAREVAEVVRRWITGQMIASVLAAIYAFAVLSILRVPNASLLAVIAGVFDVIPVVGFFCATIPAMASALTVSPTVALIVGGLYVIYHLLETYLIIPKVFGDRLKLSMLAVLIACLVAAYLAGPFAIPFVLPLVACYPVIERIWLKPHLEPDTVDKHEEMANEE